MFCPRKATHSQEAELDFEVSQVTGSQCDFQGKVTVVWVRVQAISDEDLEKMGAVLLDIRCEGAGGEQVAEAYIG